tara:strand:- start:308 stop:1057 length:750 start_codon:yes stop_codon:yes gene_type:complete
MKYFIGNWKMFGIPSSIKIIDRVNYFYSRDKKNKKKYKVIISPPHTLLESFSKAFKNKKISICAQNCFYIDGYGSHTGSISPLMIKKLGINNIIIGHSENRAAGDSEKIIKEKVLAATKNNFNVILCIGENKLEKKKKLTISVLKKQIRNALNKNFDFKKIIIAYEPIWSIGSGKLPSKHELSKIISSLKKFLNLKFNRKHNFKILYGGSVDSDSVYQFKKIKELDGFLIGGASKSSKKFIDIIKNYYK